jgi:hypothetical protein
VRTRVADQASRAAGFAYRAREYIKASQLLGLALEADPARATLWADWVARVHAAAGARAAHVAGPDAPIRWPRSPRPAWRQLGSVPMTQAWRPPGRGMSSGHQPRRGLPQKMRRGPRARHWLTSEASRRRR